MTDKDKSFQLQKPFPASDIEFRVQSCGISNNRPWAMVLAYVQARAIQKRLDEVFGWDGWTDEYRATDGNMICRLGVKTEHGWIYKENGASETQVEAFKGGISAAFKRVAASGYGIGRYLYDLTESFAECTVEKPKNMSGWNKAKTKDGKFLYWKTPTLPKWALPSEDDSSKNILIAKWKTLKYPEEKFNEWYQSQTEKGVNSEQMESYLTKKLMEMQEGA
ncbi:Rad52/Rad22 family DNA repair protein [Robertmurraya sp. DFI.2.37]|uniref:Rad52/Rad22 family DNA repair protein n=1 Tax=Robertmurraya sp. DFI.2.37 TaxID=3031819 RepID=UPI0012454FE6|nr:Rad52/Rad22 family DNA repair protein [Robertmurraya sp. DFI.2.37]MDF1510528.1 Rad52/Rad22 family DNA repair protein [Robertmurraya sp. DFI.2.37]